MPVATIVTSINELEQILKLQEENLPANISENEMRTKGFVTLRQCKLPYKLATSD